MAKNTALMLVLILITSILMYAIFSKYTPNCFKSQKTNTTQETIGITPGYWNTPLNISTGDMGGGKKLVSITDVSDSKRIMVSAVLPNGWEIIDNSQNEKYDIRFTKNSYQLLFYLARAGGGACEYPGDKNYEKSLGKLDTFRTWMGKYIEVKNNTNDVMRVSYVTQSGIPEFEGFTVGSICQNSKEYKDEFTVRPVQIYVPKIQNKETANEVVEILKNLIVI